MNKHPIIKKLHTKHGLVGTERIGSGGTTGYVTSLSFKSWTVCGIWKFLLPLFSRI